MFVFLAENIGTILVGMAVFGIVSAIIAKMIRDKRNGKSIICGSDCSSCRSNRC
ncbi:MAG: FeoB-associated Cys-rich membrane protein [Synergistaceae bacterium]|jgi:hypothetical protein|nr:FeoB-associated Cys-rich membrane protein [Synergistaceae bacterium]